VRCDAQQPLWLVTSHRMTVLDTADTVYASSSLLGRSSLETWKRTCLVCGPIVALNWEVQKLTRLGRIARMPLNDWIYLTSWFKYTQRENRCKNTKPTLKSRWAHSNAEIDGMKEEADSTDKVMHIEKRVWWFVPR